MTAPPFPDLVVLESPSARLEIGAAAGGRLSSLVVHGSEILVTEGLGPMMWGSYPMAPFAGRIRDGRFSFGGRDISLPLTMPPNAIHGTVLDRPWTVDDQVRGRSHAEARLSIDLGPDWPFAGRVSQHIVLGKGGLKVSMTLEADDPMPATIGWHPWFRRRLTGTSAAPMSASAPAQLQFDAKRMYERGPDGLPTGRLVEPVDGPWDDCFIGIDTPRRLVWPERLAVSMTSTCDHWVVYTEPEHAICVEPQSGPPNAVNLAPHVVAPGQPLTASMTWQWWSLAEADAATR